MACANSSAWVAHVPRPTLRGLVATAARRVWSRVGRQHSGAETCRRAREPQPFSYPRRPSVVTRQAHAWEMQSSTPDQALALRQWLLRRVRTIIGFGVLAIGGLFEV